MKRKSKVRLLIGTIMALLALQLPVSGSAAAKGTPPTPRTCPIGPLEQTYNQLAQEYYQIVEDWTGQDEKARELITAWSRSADQLQAAERDFIQTDYGVLFGPEATGQIHLRNLVIRAYERTLMSNLSILSRLDEPSSSTPLAGHLTLCAQTGSIHIDAIEERLTNSYRRLKVPPHFWDNYLTFISPLQLERVGGFASQRHFPTENALVVLQPSFNTDTPQHEAGHILHFRTMGSEGSDFWEQYLKLNSAQWDDGDAWAERTMENFAEQFKNVIGQPLTYLTSYDNPRQSPELAQQLGNFFKQRLAAPPKGKHFESSVTYELGQVKRTANTRFFSPHAGMVITTSNEITWDFSFASALGLPLTYTIEGTGDTKQGTLLPGKSKRTMLLPGPGRYTIRVGIGNESEVVHTILRVPDEWAPDSSAFLPPVSLPTVQKPIHEGALIDVAGHWGENAIRQGVREGLAHGYPDGTFRPNAHVTKAELLKLTAVLIKAEPQATNRMWSIPTTHWVKPWAEGLRYLEGLFVKLSGPLDQAITRKELALVVGWMAARPTDPPTNPSERFTDIEALPIDEQRIIYGLQERGIMVGMGDGRFGLDLPATRVQTLITLLRARSHIR
jgi:hypothetical protein